MAIKQVNLKNWYSVPAQVDVGSVEEVLRQPTGAGKECVAQKRREELAEAVREVSSQPRR